MDRPYAIELSMLKGRLGRQVVPESVLISFLAKNNGNVDQCFQQLSDNSWAESNYYDGSKAGHAFNPGHHRPVRSSTDDPYTSQPVAPSSGDQYTRHLVAASTNDPYPSGIAAHGTPSVYKHSTSNRPFHDNTVRHDGRNVIIEAQKRQLQEIQTKCQTHEQQIKVLDNSLSAKQKQLSHLKSIHRTPPPDSEVELQDVFLRTLKEDVAEEKEKLLNLRRTVQRPSSWECSRCCYLNHNALHNCESCNEYRHDIERPIRPLLMNPTKSWQ